MHGEEGQEEDGEVREEVEVEENQGRHMDGMRMEWQTLNGLEPCGVCDEWSNDEHSRHACRHVTHVGVHNGVNEGVEGVLVVIHTFTQPFVRELLCQEVFSKHPPSVTQMNSCFTEYTGCPVQSVFTPSLW